MTTLFVIALYVRLYGVYLWGWFINEFDPYIRFFMAKELLKHGLLWWLQGGDNVTYDKFWYPWGINWTKTLNPGVSLFGVLTYYLLSPFGFDLFKAVIVSPAIFNALTVPAMFYLGYRLDGKWTGLLAALWAAVGFPFVQRGLAGWFDDNPYFQFLATLSLALFIDSLKSTGVRRWITLVLAAFVSGLTVWTWGAYVYLWNAYAAFLVLYAIYALYKQAKGLPISDEYRRFYTSYIPIYMGFLLFVLITPRYGLSFLKSGLTFLPHVALIFSAFPLVINRLKNVRLVLFIPRALLIAVICVMAVLATFMAIGKLVGGKYLGVLNPLLRSPIVQSVAEHLPSSYAQAYANLGATLPFAIAGFAYSAFTLDIIGLFLAVNSVLALYFASSEVWLFMVQALFWTPIAAYGIIKLLEMARRAGRGEIVKYVSTAVICIIAILVFIFALSYPLYAASSPPQIVSTTQPSIPAEDWLDALRWLAYATPKNATVLAWWDYGYWISVIGNRTSLADNSTVNSTQIALIASFFLSNPNDPKEVLRLLDRLGRPGYIMIFEPYTTYGPINMTGIGLVCVLIPERPLGGDFVKSYWMARIAGYSDNAIFNKFLSRGRFDGLTLYVPYSNDTYNAVYNTTLYRLMFNMHAVLNSYIVWRQCLIRGARVYWVFERVWTVLGAKGGLRVVEVPLPGYEGPTTSWGYLLDPPDWARLVYVSRPHGWVLIYRIDYKRLEELVKARSSQARA